MVENFCFKLVLLIDGRSRLNSTYLWNFCFCYSLITVYFFIIYYFGSELKGGTAAGHQVSRGHVDVDRCSFAEFTRFDRAYRSTATAKLVQSGIRSS